MHSLLSNIFNRHFIQNSDQRCPQSLAIGTQFLNLKFEKSGEFDTNNYNEWVDALNRNMKSASLWKTNENAVQVIRGALFRTEVDLPANITTGDYEVRIIHFRNGRFIIR